jgi:cell wall-associated NlpC family hydrolase
MDGSMSRSRHLPATLIALLVLAAPGSAVAAVPGLGGWNRGDQRAVTRAGLMPSLDDGRFHGERRLSGAQLRNAFAGLWASLSHVAPAAPSDGSPPPAPAVAPAGDPSGATTSGGAPTGSNAATPSGDAPAATPSGGASAATPSGDESPGAPSDGSPAPAPAAFAPVATPSGRVSVATFDALLVEQLGLADVAAAVQQEASRAGLQPPERFGAEVVARQLGLRFNHPAPHDGAELFPTDAITRAEAAYSLARILDFQGWEITQARETLSRFVLPEYSERQRQALRIAVSKIGMPYIWGGETDTRAGVWGAQAHGGYDCSGFVWRVFKNTGVVRSIAGRTAAQMAGEIPRSRRVRFDAIQPADVLFFGSGRFWQKATEQRIVHTGIALSPTFMIHSSSQGVYVSELSGARRDQFSWARRLL